ncbi:SGNH/GDSL hydrolase family protein [Allorhizocola rhizosphaerae]|uniref:SGNH/GDSL hydrolase family protein n=1 Tax=Allorhizocola rhizosphaerae TaxID=1872709 RepID=UPI001FE95773|nr:SGNH/GDSL hydrolase family protein [Allorhizocola rhizosphaerae]
MEADDPYCLSHGEAETLLTGHPWRRFAVIGDSTAEGIGDRVPGYSNLPWCDRIAHELARTTDGFEYLNLGKRELKAAEVRESQLAAALAFRPDLAMVSCGGNDALRASYRPDEVDRELTAMVRALQDIGADVMTVSVFDISYAPSFPEKVRAVVGARMQKFGAHCRELSARTGTIHVYCTNHPAQTDPAMYSADGLHGNLRLHSICAAIAIRRLGAHLKGMRAAA